MLKTEHRKASDIYKAQNTLIHKAFSLSGLSYEDNKEVWLELINQLLQPPPAPSRGGQRPTSNVEHSTSNQENGNENLQVD